MAPDSSLHRHHLGGFALGGMPSRSLTVALLFLSLLPFIFHAQAKAEDREFPGVLAALSSPLESVKQETPAALSTPADALMGTPPVLWRNRIQIPIHEPLIQKYIRFYQGDGRKTFSEAMEKAKTCIPQMTEILESHGVPAELVAIVFVESRFEKHAQHRGAGGYWQMLAPTARVMGLRVDKYIDERRDPIKSTKAAAKYLKQLHERYDSWLLALAAYNAGCGPISCAVNSHRVKEGELYGRKGLPARSMAYVSKVLAAVHVMSMPEEYGFERPKYCKSKDFDPVLVKSPLHLADIAKWIDVPVGQLKELNPSLRLDTMPPDSGFALRLPAGTREQFRVAYLAHSQR